jgi:CheY-like chemotaxis protein/anti-sigma regulatory factor (Ser/Thr protein kinase)
VLVVDDNADMRAYLTRLLAPHWAVRTTANGEEALAAIATDRPDVVLTDVMMPRIDGFALLRALRADPATADIPVIMLTARAGQEASVEGLDAGADDYLAKPFRAAELVARVRVALDRAAGRSPAAGPGSEGLPGPAPSPGTPPWSYTAVPQPRVESVVALPAPTQGASADAAAPAVAWRFPSTVTSVPAVRRRLRLFLDAATRDPDEAYDLLLAACEAVTNAIEHAREPTQPYVDVSAAVLGGQVRIAVRDYGQWRERQASMDRGRGGALMSAFADVTATRSPEGTTVVICSRRAGDRS